MQGLAGHVGYQSRPTTQQLVAGFQLLGAIKFHSGNETRHSLCLCFLAVPGVFQTVFVCICGISINFHYLLFTRSPSFLEGSFTACFWLGFLMRNATSLKSPKAWATLRRLKWHDWRDKDTTTLKKKLPSLAVHRPR